MNKTKETEHRFTEMYPDPTAGKAIENIENEAKRKRLSVLELEFLGYTERKLKGLIEGIRMERGQSIVTRTIKVTIKDKYSLKQFEICTPKKRMDFEMKYQEIKRRAGI